MQSLTSFFTQVKSLVIGGVFVACAVLVGWIISGSNENSAGDANASVVASSTTSIPGPRPLAPLGTTQPTAPSTDNSRQATPVTSPVDAQPKPVDAQPNEILEPSLAPVSSAPHAATTSTTLVAAGSTTSTTVPSTTSTTTTSTTVPPTTTTTSTSTTTSTTTTTTTSTTTTTVPPTTTTSTSTTTTTTTIPITSPQSPTALALIAGNGQVTLSWAAPTQDGGDPISDYVVQYKASSSSSWLTFVDGVSPSTTATVASLVNDTLYDFQVAAVNSVGTGTPSSVASTTPTITYAVGDTGPGGGVIYYVANTPFACGVSLSTQCTYLEVSPTSWNTPPNPSATYTNVVAAMGANRSAVGAGYQNTLDAVNQAGVNGTHAPHLARAYQGNGKTDWHIPSSLELRELCKYARQQPSVSTATACNSTGTIRAGFIDTGIYFSSTESGTDRIVWVTFGTGGSSSALKTSNQMFRPIRAF